MSDFRFDEVVINKILRDELDRYLPGVLLARPAMLGDGMGLKVIVSDRLASQNNESVFRIIIRQLTESMAMGIAKLQATNSRVLLVHPMEFDYVRGEYDNGKGGLEPGVEVRITAKVEELEA